VHKSQGVTVDRTHVLATVTWTGVCRVEPHQERVDLHWSADERGSRERLTRVLGRERPKDTSLDYGLAPRGTAKELRMQPELGESGRAYAERRGFDPMRPLSEARRRRRPAGA
jgi:hypothetical protein